MAGMLPGVECARRRRFHQSGGCLDSPSMAARNSTRRSSFCLYASNHESLLFPSSSLAYPDDKLGRAAREAKQRLDDKFRVQRKSQNKRQNSKEKLKCVESIRTTIAELHIDEHGSKKNGSRRFSWTKLNWKASEQEDCAVCLESWSHSEMERH